jgi:hypothetical protein
MPAGIANVFPKVFPAAAQAAVSDVMAKTASCPAHFPTALLHLAGSCGLARPVLLGKRQRRRHSEDNHRSRHQDHPSYSEIHIHTPIQQDFFSVRSLLSPALSSQQPGSGIERSFHLTQAPNSYPGTGSKAAAGRGTRKAPRNIKSAASSMSPPTATATTVITSPIPTAVVSIILRVPLLPSEALRLSASAQGALLELRSTIQMIHWFEIRFCAVEDILENTWQLLHTFWASRSGMNDSLETTPSQ